MTDIVERLRACPGVMDHDPECNCQEAADEIERLWAMAQRDEKSYQAEIKRLQTRIKRWEAQSIAQYAEITRLRTALHNIGIGGNGERNWTLDEVYAVAWDALEPLSNDKS